MQYTEATLLAISCIVSPVVFYLAHMLSTKDSNPMHSIVTLMHSDAAMHVHGIIHM